MAGSNPVAIAAGQILNLAASNGYTLNVSPGLVFTNGGTLNVGPGTVNLPVASVGGAGAVNLGVSNNGLSSLVNNSGSPATFANSFNIYDNGGFTSLSGLTLTGTATLTGPDNGGITQLFVAANSNVTFAGVISGGTKGITLRQVSGASSGGFLTLSGPNIYSGPTGISAGTMIVGGNVTSAVPGPLGNGTGAVTIGDANSGNNPAALLINGPYAIGLPVTVNATAGPTTLGSVGGRLHVQQHADSERQQHRHAQQRGRRLGSIREYRRDGNRCSDHPRARAISSSTAPLHPRRQSTLPAGP